MRDIRSSANRRGFTLAELLAAVAALALVAALTIPVAVRSKRHARLMACQANLRQLHGALQGVIAAKKEHPTGRALWASLKLDGLLCPLRTEEDDHSQEPSYWGPAVQLAAAGDRDPVACDDPGNHSRDGRRGGNLLRKSGEVLLDDTLVGETALWASAIRTYCKP